MEVARQSNNDFLSQSKTSSDVLPGRKERVPKDQSEFRRASFPGTQEPEQSPAWRKVSRQVNQNMDGDKRRDKCQRASPHPTFLQTGGYSEQLDAGSLK